ncbi:hypothetical protein ALUC_40014S [Aspergillus luchuensis]|nr:hypothetical protein ALUC_40014S [Aspergillus luchuensis]
MVPRLGGVPAHRSAAEIVNGNVGHTHSDMRASDADSSNAPNTFGTGRVASSRARGSYGRVSGQGFQPVGAA